MNFCLRFSLPIWVCFPFSGWIFVWVNNRPYRCWHLVGFEEWSPLRTLFRRAMLDLFGCSWSKPPPSSSWNEQRHIFRLCLDRAGVLGIRLLGYTKSARPPTGICCNHTMIQVKWRKAKQYLCHGQLIWAWPVLLSSSYWAVSRSASRWSCSRFGPLTN